MLVWAVRMIMVWGGVGVACFYAWENRIDLLPAEMIREALKRRDKVSPREQLYIDALAA